MGALLVKWLMGWGNFALWIRTILSGWVERKLWWRIFSYFKKWARTSVTRKNHEENLKPDSIFSLNLRDFKNNYYMQNIHIRFSAKKWRSEAIYEWNDLIFLRLATTSHNNNYREMIALVNDRWWRSEGNRQIVTHKAPATANLLAVTWRDEEWNI